MKKYIAPATQCVALDNESVLAGSQYEISETGTNKVWSSHRENSDFEEED